MSFVADRRWEVEARKRREIYLNRIRNVTAAYARRNRERLDALVEQGLDVYVAEDYRAGRNMLERVERHLAGDPETSRDENIKLSSMLRSIFSTARGNRRAAQAVEWKALAAARDAERRVAREKLASARAELLGMIIDARKSLPGPTARDHAQSDLRSLREEIEKRTINLEEFAQIRNRLTLRLDSIKAAACGQADLTQAKKRT